MKRSRWNNLLNMAKPLVNKTSTTLEKEAVIQNSILDFENREKHKRAEELIYLRKESASESLKRGIIAAELVVANEEIVSLNEENERFANELLIVKNDLIEAKSEIEEHINGLEDIMFITSHKVRQPIANILGIASILDQFLKAPATMKKMVGYIKESSLSLDSFTRELTALVKNLKKKN